MAKKSETKIINTLTYRTIYARLECLALNVFKWSGLPKSVKPEYIEKALYRHGEAVFFKDSKIGYCCLQCMSNSQLNIYEEPVKYRAIGLNYSEPYNIDDSVRIKNNLALIPTKAYMELYARRLYEIDRTCDVNVIQQKSPYIITCDDKDLLSFKNIFSEVEENVIKIYADKHLNINSINVLETNAPFVCDKLSDYKHEVWNDLLTFLGMNNSNTDKKERLITDEVNSNNEFIEMSVDYMLEERLKACDMINEMFPDLKVSVELKNKPIPVQADPEADPEPDQGSEGNQDG